MEHRRTTKRVKVGSLVIGGGAPVSVQSMPTVKTAKVAAVVRQIRHLARAGCDLIRVSVLDEKDARAIKAIVRASTIPVCADIHFSRHLALEAIAAGAHKIRINPGNMTATDDVRSIIAAARERHIAIRVGANSGSVDGAIHRGTTMGERLASAVLAQVALMEKLRFTNLVVSAKAHSVSETIDAYRHLARRVSYPLHIGLTATGCGEYALIKSTVGLGSLLSQGIGDTVRVSLADDPVHEVTVAVEMLQALGLRARPWEVIACPTCGRTEIDVIGLATTVERLLQAKKIVPPRPAYKIAVMGCVVNGPGEAKDADIGISGGRGFGFVFKQGNMIQKVAESQLLGALRRAIADDK